ncbi:hypothetical protein [Pseudonocardia oceani]|uniref:Lipopolysaccharide assembly protein A domain-containing protein n=1 Tax=Pseudonocardia oceani TaxID=2792013 RepID=A0ABS6UI35_9PSEU|nr:hypothetical protein [Pseudonocardia oceani]MBW0123949.1 hypothetical protein [Pseudonocardia oceani]MBW0131890.1 hypothetical protein [Pseudonocardia oceani]
MLWLFAQIWVWLIVALALGVLAGWLFWARPLRRRVAELEATHGQAPPARAAA